MQRSRAVLARAVGRVPRRRVTVRNGADGDHVALPASPHGRKKRAQHAERCGEVEVKRALEVIRIHVVHTGERKDAGAVDQDVRCAAAPLRDPVSQSVDVASDRQISRNRQMSGAELARQSGQLRRRARGKRHVRTGEGERASNGLAYASRRARDKRPATFERHRKGIDGV